jgi:hypothetical protein
MNYQEYYKYGYYQVSDRITRSKLEAIEWCQPKLGWPSYHYHDEIFSSYNWQQEPLESLESLYQSRAKELREKYDYIIVMYSGGSDSHNMLMSFLSQDLVPDEIAYFHHSFSDENNVMNLEWNLQTSIRLAPILEKWPKIKLRRIDMTDMVLNFMREVVDDAPYLSTNVGPNNSLRSSFNHLIKDWFDIKNQGRSLRMLYGVDKPRLRFDGKNYIFNFYDTIRNGAIDKSEVDDHEWFYWSPECPKICIKQSHVVKRFWQVNQHRWKDLNCIYNNNLGWIFDKENQEVMHLIYPWCESRFLTWRPASDFYGYRDIEILTANSEISKKYLDMCNSLVNRIDPMYFNQGKLDKGFVGSITRDYCVD